MKRKVRTNSGEDENEKEAAPMLPSPVEDAARKRGDERRRRRIGGVDG